MQNLLSLILTKIVESFLTRGRKKFSKINFWETMQNLSFRAKILKILGKKS